MRISSFPPDFTAWDDSDLECDDFFHFRESSATDSLAACHKELGTAILRHVSSMLHQGSTWQLKEAGLFVARAISPAVCTAAMGAGLNGVLGAGGGEDEQGVSTAFVTSLYENLPKASEGKAQGFRAKTTVRLTCALWVNCRRSFDSSGNSHQVVSLRIWHILY